MFRNILRVGVKRMCTAMSIFPVIYSDGTRGNMAQTVTQEVQSEYEENLLYAGSCRVLE